MSKHTPRRWVKSRGPMKGKQIWTISETNRQTTGGRLIHVATLDPRNGEANAHLIAAAPDMQEALINTLALASHEWGYLDKHANVVFEQARAALAKSRGQS